MSCIRLNNKVLSISIGFQLTKPYPVVIWVKLHKPGVYFWHNQALEVSKRAKLHLVEEGRTRQHHGELTGVVGIVEPRLVIYIPGMKPSWESHNSVSGLPPHPGSEERGKDGNDPNRSKNWGYNNHWTALGKFLSNICTQKIKLRNVIFIYLKCMSIQKTHNLLYPTSTFYTQTIYLSSINQFDFNLIHLTNWILLILIFILFNWIYLNVFTTNLCWF